MPDLSLNSTYSSGWYRFRALKRTDPPLRGADVYALQTALGVEADGIFGKQTENSVRAAQIRLAPLIVDGIAGLDTQRRLADEIARSAKREHAIPDGLLYGQIEHESGFQLGNHTGPYPNHTRDLGVVQRNTGYATAIDAFHAPKSIGLLAKQLRENHDAYQNLGVITDERRLWELAAGSWNAPAWTLELAKGHPLKPQYLDQIEAYIRHATAYLKGVS